MALQPKWMLPYRPNGQAIVFRMKLYPRWKLLPFVVKLLYSLTNTAIAIMPQLNPASARSRVRKRWLVLSPIATRNIAEKEAITVKTTASTDMARTPLSFEQLPDGSDVLAKTFFEPSTPPKSASHFVFFEIVWHCLLTSPTQAFHKPKYTLGFEPGFWMLTQSLLAHAMMKNAVAIDRQAPPTNVPIRLTIGIFAVD